jgi:hypothetical protein
MIGSTLGAFVMAGILSTFLMLGRSGANLVNYTTMDAQTRRSLEDFAQDVRMASNVAWNGENSITLTVPGNYTSNSNLVTYAWDNTPSSSTYQTFYRQPGNPGSGATRTTYITNVTSFNYLRFDRLNASASTDISTKRVQLRMTIARSNSTVVSATDTTLSASFVLRNKITN